jgi:hypothetical protein
LRVRRHRSDATTSMSRNDWSLRIAVVPRLGSTYRNSAGGVEGSFSCTSGLEKLRDRTDRRIWAQVDRRKAESLHPRFWQLPPPRPRSAISASRRLQPSGERKYQSSATGWRPGQIDRVWTALHWQGFFERLCNAGWCSPVSDLFCAARGAAGQKRKFPPCRTSARFSPRRKFRAHFEWAVTAAVDVEIRVSAH